MIAAIGCMFSCSPDAFVKIGVLLPLTGSYFSDFKETLDWAVDNVNSAGGINGQQLMLIYKDTAVIDVDEAAQAFIDDDSIKAVIGPLTSKDTFRLAPRFIQAKKPIVTPSATSEEIYRAFAGEKYIWRTVESDIAQVKMLLIMAADKGAEKVSLICGSDVYGSTFFTWFGFFATELGFEVGAVVQYDHAVTDDCSIHVSKALKDGPDILIAVPSTTAAAVCIARQVQDSSCDTKILFSDGGQLDAVIDALGDDAEGIEGTALSPDMSTGFEIAYRVIFDRQPPPFAANVYDAVVLLAYGLARSDGKGGEALADALIEVTAARGEETGWDAQEIETALSAIRSESLPDISGATGPLDYDSLYHVDMTSSTYACWRIEAGAFVTHDFLTTGNSTGYGAVKGLSIFQTLATEAALQDLETSDSTVYSPSEKTGLWAFIMAGSDGWGNYRHQADALAQYSLLKENGVSDDRIILVIEDDIAENSVNPEPGVIRNIANGPNLYTEIEVDYHPSELSSEDIVSILSGQSSIYLPHVIESGPGDNLLVFIVSHGGIDGIILAADESVGENLFTPQDLGEAVDILQDSSDYLRTLIIVEACHGGTMGQYIDQPGVLLLASANPFENSLGANYDSSIRAWLSDQFAFHFYLTAALLPEISIIDLYEDLYLGVNGSHVTVYNAEQFGSVSSISLEEFYEP